MFEDAFAPDTPLADSAGRWSRQGTETELLQGFRAAFAGSSFNRGLYRVPGPALLERLRPSLASMYPERAPLAEPFGVDWLGRVAALDGARLVAGWRQVSLFEPGAHEILETDADLRGFHDGELVEFADAALASAFHADWLATGGAPPGLDECVGYRVPLFLGGEDGLDNLELVDLEVYWSITAQVVAGLRAAGRA